MDKLFVKKLRKDAVLPCRATPQSAGYDLCACIDEPAMLPAREKVLIPTGIAIGIEDENAAALVFGRSGMGIRQGICPSNAVGVIDADYRGEIMVGLTNHSNEDYVIQPGERIAQMVLIPVLTPGIVEAAGLSETERGEGGFGSTGR